MQPAMSQPSFIAGHETTGATLSRVLPELQKNPEILAQLKAEQDSVISRYGDSITCVALSCVFMCCWKNYNAACLFQHS